MTNLASLPRTFWFYCWGSYSQTLSLPRAHWKGGQPTPRALLRDNCFLFLSLATETVSNCKGAASLVDNQNRGISLKPDVTWHSAQSCQGKERIHEKGNMIHFVRGSSELWWKSYKGIAKNGFLEVGCPIFISVAVKNRPDKKYFRGGRVELA